MKQLAVMIKPASSLCNMRCRYCFYADISSLREVRSFGVMKDEVSDRIIENIFADLEDGDRLTIAFQGGEPTMAGLPYFRHFTEQVGRQQKKVKAEYALQTNALILDEEWCSFLHDHRVLTGVSFDILSEEHDYARPDAAGKGTYKRIRQSLKLLKEHKVEFNVLCTLTRQVARHPAKVWAEIRKLGIDFVQFTPCLDELESPGESPFALTPERFADFYKKLFDLWYEAFSRDEYISIKLFDDLVNLLSRGMLTACGICGSCQPQIVVEADGSVYPCDFYCLDKYRLGSFTEQTIRELYERSKASESKKPERLPQHCAGCRYISICHGGCKRMRREVCLSEGDSYCGYQDFLDYSIERLQRIARAIR